jgi:hypothetical protein
MQVLALCFRELSSRSPSTIANAAAAIVRQAVAIVFDHAAAKSTLLSVTSPSQVRDTARGSADTNTAAAPNDAAAQTPRTELALVLLKELCLLARGHSSQLLDCGPPAMTFMVDVLNDTLRDNVGLLRSRGLFLDVLREDVCGVLHHILKTQQEAEPETVNVHRYLQTLSYAAASCHVTVVPLHFHSCCAILEPFAAVV